MIHIGNKVTCIVIALFNHNVLGYYFTLSKEVSTLLPGNIVMCQFSPHSSHPC